MRGGQQQQQQQQQGQPPPPLQSWYPPPVVGPSNTGLSRVPPPPNFGAPPPGINPLAWQPISDARPASSIYPSSTLSGSYSRGYTRPNSSQVSSSGSYSSNSGASNSMASLEAKSPEELTRLLNDKDAYNAYLHSLDDVRRLDTINAELEKSTIDESRNNLMKESELAELRTQCMIIRNTELAVSRERFEELEKRYKDIQANCSIPALLHKLQDATNEADEVSENLHRKFLAGEIELLEFIREYRQLRLLYHRRSLIRMSALSSMPTPG